MENLKRLLNRIAREQHFTTAQNQLAKASYDCGLMNDMLNDLVASGPGYETRRLTAFREIGLRIKRMKIHIEDICDSDYFIVDGLMELVEAILVLIEESICILNWLGGIQGVVLRASLGTLGAIITYLKTLANNPLLFHDAKDLWCRSMQRIIFALDGLDILEELGIDEGPTLQVQSIPETCPEVVNEGWIRDHLNQYDEIKGQVLEIVIAILLGLSAAIAAALAAAALIGPAALASAIATATAAIQSALAWLIGQQAAATVAAGIVAAISTKCIADDTEIEVKEPTEVCCFEGEIIDDVPGGEKGCEEIGGAWGDPEDTECGPYQQGK